MYGRRHGGRPPFALLDPEFSFGGRGFGSGRRGGSRGGRRGGRGGTRAAILLLLAEEPRSGHQIIQEAGERSGGLWSPRPGAVYPTLQQLADEGLVRGEESEGRRIFTLTDEGRAHVEAEPPTAPWTDALAGAGDLAEVLKDAARIGTALVQVARDGTPEQIAEARKLADDTRRRLYGILAEDRAEPADGTAAEEK